MKLIPNGENLNMIEYYESNQTCHGPIYGVWVKQVNGYVMRVRVENTVFEMAIQAIFHDYSGEDNDEMNMVLYGCRRFKTDDSCEVGEQMASIVSNSRHPQTLAVASCGDEIVDNDQKLVNAQIDSEGELIESECKDEPRTLTVTAFMDPVLLKEDISHISCFFTSKYEANCEWIRHEMCFKSNLTQSFQDAFTIESSTILQLKNTSSIDIDWSGTLLWHNGDECIIYKCIDINEDGTCDQYRIYVWSDEDLMDQPTIRTIYDELDTICCDPTNLIFLNTFHECDEANMVKVPSVKCGLLPGWSPVNTQLLEGVWFFAADINADPKIYMQSAVVEMTTSRASYADCFNTQMTVLSKRQNQILYVDNLRMLLYWCFNRAQNGSCIQYDVDILVRTRHLAYHDLAILDPYLKMACVSHDQLRWFDLHSRCGLDMSQTTKLRRTVMTLSHKEVLDILTNVQEPRCKKELLKGLKVDLSAIEKAGKWLLVSRYDHFEFDTYAMIGRIRLIEPGKAIVKVFQSAARSGSQKKCYQRMFVLIEHADGDDNGDITYHLYFESLLGSKAFSKLFLVLILRFLFMNRHVGVIYSCIAYNKTGQCAENALYVISRHESIDHTELSVLETVANSVCIPVEHLVHVAFHDDCIHENHHLKLATVAFSTVSVLPKPVTFDENIQQLKHRYKNNTYFAIASSSPERQPFLLKFNNGYVQKLAQYSGEFPSLLPIKYDYTIVNQTKCEALLKPSCLPKPIHFHPSQVATTGEVAMLNEHFAILYSTCDQYCTQLPDERRATVWTRNESTELNDSVRNVLQNLCILDDEMDNKTGESKCW
ncbi:unnamed protein product [Anisakis simplex]|uniref:Tudor domain-containing protein n=1 Tax=Anisakis simplex TaxID=6269 RepID=A0A0M3JR03_ANISI|nr:unnamed protein product [Anisakis simplex]